MRPVRQLGLACVRPLGEERDEAGHPARRRGGRGVLAVGRLADVIAGGAADHGGREPAVLGGAAGGDGGPYRVGGTELAARDGGSSAGENLVRVVEHDRAGDVIVNRLVLRPVTKSTNEVISVMKPKMPVAMPPMISRRAMYQKPATRLVSGLQHRIPSTCCVGVCPLPQMMRPQMIYPMPSVTMASGMARK